ncbi:hypothetical protein [Haloplanus rubicundus]|uniref:Uncharacterized protein n=1 Tax=Haloplanus rubicundus TaxID=1547898 RepID=A0A345E8U3_9EURY|nr:hypothetical protein [Haloplanus rubicundus]AXG08615.1 hypothetical protein DU484_01395 [Haloplanus rubicundus]
MSANDDSRDSGIESAEYGQPRVEPWKDEDRLRRLYHEEGKSQYEIANQFDIKQPTVKYWMNKFGIDTRPSNREKDRQSIYRFVDDDGKIMLLERDDEGVNYLVYIHQVVALEDFHAKDVFKKGNDVHHLLGSPHAIDVPENLTVLSKSEHVRQHAEGTATDDPETVLQHIFDEFDPELEIDESDDNADTDTDDGGIET